MSRITKIGISVADSDDALSEIRDALAAAGWTTHDDQISASSYVVMHNGGGADGDELTYYMRFDHDSYADYINYAGYLYWDNSAHSGTIKMGQLNYHRVQADDDGSFNLWIFATQDFVSIVTKVGTTYQGGFFGKFVRFHDKPLGTLQGAVTSGTDKVLTLAAGEADDFEVGETYQILENGTHAQERPEVTAVNSASNQITVDSLSAGFGAGAKIGYTPFPYFQIGAIQSATYFICLFPPDKTNTTDILTDEGNLVVMFSTTHFDPETLTGRYLIVPGYVDIDNASIGGFLPIDSIGRISFGSSPIFEETLEVGSIDSGTAESGTTSTLTDTDKSWTVDEHDGKAVIITAGTGQGQIGQITANTATALTVSETWPVAPSSDSQYVICDEAWIAFSWSASLGYAMRAA